MHMRFLSRRFKNLQWYGMTFKRNGIDASGEKSGASTVSVHKEVFSYERSVATSVMEAAAFSLSVVDSWP